MSFLKPFVLILFLPFSLFAAERVSADYDVTFSIFGKIGEAKVSYWNDGSRYHIMADAGLTGEAAKIGSNRREIHESFGIIKEGVLIPELYKVDRRADHYHYLSYFAFFPQSQEIKEYRIREDYGTKRRFDVKSFKWVSEPTVKRKFSIKELDYYAQNDLQSLFFNVQNLMNDMGIGDSKIVHAVGGSPKNKGQVMLGRPAGEKRQELMELMPTHQNRLITVLVNQDIFKSDKGELWISLDDDLLVKEAMLKDVLLFGDIHGYRTTLNKEL